MSMSPAFINLVANAGAGGITHWGLVDASGTELTGGGYARMPSAGVNSAGTVRASADVQFQVPAGTVVAGWRAFNALSGGTNWGGQNITPTETYGSAGIYNLAVAQTSVPFGAQA